MNDLNPDLLAALRAHDEDDEDEDRIPARAQVGEALPLSHAQQQLWFLQSYEPTLVAYNLPRAFRLHGELNADAMERAFQALIARHAVLRTRFEERGGVPVQVIQAQVPFALQRIDFSALAADEREAQTRAEAARIAAQVFDLGQAPAMVAALIRLGPQEHVLAVCMHHIVSDAWSNPILARDLAQAYAQALSGTAEVQLPAPAIQYADYALWQRERIANGEMAAQLKALNDKLGAQVPVLELPLDKARPEQIAHRGAALQFALNPAQSQALQAFARAEKCTPFAVLMTAWQLLLARLSGQQDFAIGVPNAGRSREELQELLGFFITTQVFRVRLQPSMRLREACRQVRGDAMQALSQGDLPFELLLESRKQARDPARSPLFQVMFGLRVADGAEQLGLAGLRAEALEFDAEGTVQGAKHELSLDFELGTDRVAPTVRGRLEYNTDLFHTATAQRITEAYVQVLERLLQAPESRVGDLDIVTPADQQQLAAWGQGPAIAAPADVASLLAHQRIARQAALRPNATALIHDELVWTHTELNARANRLAHRLIESGLPREARVGIAVERSAQMVVALLAVLKAGGVYVPLDPQYPADRLAHMIDDAGIAWLLTDRAQEARWMALVSTQRPSAETALATAVWAIDALDLSNEPAHDPAIEVHPQQLAYVIYTSGSTGKPKGVGIPHHALAAHAEVGIGFFGLTADDRMLQFSTLNFDGCIEQIYPPLCAGAAIVLRGPDLWDSDTFHRELLRHRITVADLTTAYWFLLVQDFARRGLRDHGVLRQVHAGGEAMPPEGLKAWRDAGMSHIRLLNTYGPTEATVTATVLDCGPLVATAAHNDLPTQMSIGLPLAGREVYVVDGEMNLVPPGVPGELCIGGELLARGYGRRPGLSAERFIANPWGPAGSRLYRTGDLVRWMVEDAATPGLQYLGRIDHQVKIRGFRIELGEVEAQLLGEPGVRQAVALAHGAAGSARLVAYVSPKAISPQDGSAAAEALSPQALRTKLAASLPDYMVPSVIVVLPKLPLNPNGKVDRAALPAPEASAPATTTAGNEAQTDTERAIATVWQQVLRLPQVGRDDNFFELGGDSILSLQIVARLRQAGWRVTPRQMFERQTIARLALVAEALVDGSAPDAATEPVRDIPLLPIQARFFETPVPNRNHWNQSVLLHSDAPLRAEQIREAVAALVQHHPVLRARFAPGAGEPSAHAWTQHIAEAASTSGNDLLWTRQAHSADDITRLCTEAQRSLSITTGPLLRALLIDAGPLGHRLLLVVHHLVVDGVSWRILLDDLQTACAQRQAGQPIALTSVTASAARWATLLQSRAASFSAQMPHWLAHAGVPVTLPLADAHGEHRAGTQHNLRWQLDAATTQALLQTAPAAYRTQVNDLLLAALARALCRWAGHDELLIDLEGHGREAFDGELDLSRSVGWFTTLHPLKLDGQGSDGELIGRIKERLRAVPERGLGHGALRHLGSEAERAALAALPQPQVVFNYLGQFDEGEASADESRSSFRLAHESAGPALDEQTPPEHELSILGQVYHGELTMELRHSPARLPVAAVEALGTAFRDELLALIEHCRHGAKGVTASDFPLAKLDATALNSLALPVDQLADLYPVSPMQAGMLFHAAEAEGLDGYLTQMRVDIGGLDAARFHAAWQAVYARHDVLRTGFLTSREQALQWVKRPDALACAMHDWCGLSADEQAQKLDALAQQDLALGFDLQQPPLMRLSLVQTATAQGASSSHHFIWTCHHLLVDGWSASQLLGEVLRHYAGEAIEPSPPYRDHIAWLQARDAAASEAHWREQLQPLAEPSLLARAMPPTAATSLQDGEAEFAVHAIEIDALATQRLADQAKRLRLTVNTLVQAAWALLLHRHTGQASVCFGATVSGRPDDLPGADRMVGLFINTLPVVSTLPPQLAVSDWLQQLQAAQLASREHEHTPLYDIQRWAGRPGQALFDTLIVFENYPIDEALSRAAPGGLSFSRAANEERTNYPLTLAVSLSNVLRIKFGHARSSFSDAAVARLATQFRQLLSVFAEAGTADSAQPLADKRLGEIGLQLAADQAQLQAWGSPRYQGPAPEAVHLAIERQAAQQPTAPALWLDGATLDFGSLNRRANQLAHWLQAQGLQAEGKVGVVVERTLDTFVALLAVLKAGAAYVPLDPEYPVDRLAYMLQDSGVSLLLTHSQLASQLAGLQATAKQPLPSWNLDTLPLDKQSAHNLDLTVHPEQLAYVIYTSGSTGQPKGVAVAHGPLAMHCDATAELYEMGSHSREFHFLSLAFDGAHERWLTGLRIGGSLVVRGPGLWSAEQTYDTLRQQHATHGGFPPAYLQQLADHAHERRETSGLFLLSFGGEAMSRAGFAHARDALQPQRMLNGYGPTEAVVTPMAWKAMVNGPFAQFDQGYAPIGSPCGDRTAHVLDADGQPVPPGVAGELYLGGSGLARGYLHRAGLTAERFIADPFSTNGGRLYRTGDWVRWITEGPCAGQIEYLGRIDQQVKVRGFRIEIGEVEAHLRALPGVNEAVALARLGPGGQRLIGYVTPQAQPLSGEASSSAQAESQLDGQALRRQLAAQLPDYMVPSAIVVLPRFPVTPNGKVDRAKLPEPPALAAGSHITEAPQGEAEQALATVWAEVLGLPAIGRHDNFFDLGGDSIISLQIVAKARRAGWKVGPKQIFEASTLEALARVAQRLSGAAEGHTAAQGVLSGEVPLLPLQEHFLQLQAPNPNHWNQAVLLRSEAAIDLGVLGRALDALLTHHDALRLRFQLGSEGHWIQEHTAPTPDPERIWRRSARDAAQVTALCDEAQRSLDLKHGPLLRALVIEVEGDGSRLLLAIHHLVVDGVSWRVLLDDLQTAYAQLLRGEAVQLPAKTSAYQQWSQRLRDWAGDAATLAVQQPALSSNAQALHWGGDPQASGSHQPATLKDQQTVRFELDAQATQSLLREAPAAYRTQVNDLLLTALGRALQRCASPSSEEAKGVWIDLESHGRAALFDDMDLSRTVGWFTAVHPVFIAAGGEPGAAICRVKDALAAVPAQGLAHGVAAAHGPAEAREALACLPTREVLFNYMGQLDAAADSKAAGTWTLASESPGASSDAGMPLSHELVFNGEVLAGRLQMTLGFSGRRQSVARMQALLDAYREELQQLIAHCLHSPGGLSASDVPMSGLSTEALNALVGRLGLPARDIEDLYPLTPGQQQMLDESLQAAGSDVNLVQMQARVDDLDMARLQSAWQQAVARHDAMRTVFVPAGVLEGVLDGFLDGKQPALQLLLKPAAMTEATRIELLDWRGKAPAQAEADWAALCVAERRQLDLQRAPLARWCAVQLSDQSYRLAWTWHHLLLDGWSMSRMLGEVFTAYAGEPLAAPGPRLREFVRAVQASQPSDAAIEAARWRRLDAEAGGATLLRGLPIGAVAHGGFGAQAEELPTERVQALHQFAKAQQVTVNTLLQAAWAKVLMDRTGRHGASFGVTQSGRSLEMDGIDQVMGLCINNLPLMLKAEPQQTVGTWLREVFARNLEMRQAEHAAEADIQRAVGRPGQMLYDTQLVFENYPIDAAVSGGAGAALQLTEVAGIGAPGTPLTLIAMPGAQRLALSLEYARAAYRDDEVCDLLRQLIGTLDALVVDAAQALSQVTVPAAQVALSAGPAGSWRATPSQPANPIASAAPNPPAHRA